MQVQKDDIRRQILKVAGKQFLKKGYLKTSMREIAGEAGVGVGNLYNYFPNKDELFQSVVSPVTTLLEQMLQRHHGNRCGDVCEMDTESYYKYTMDEYVTLVRKHRTLMTILFFRTQGSSLENYFERFADHATEVTKEWIAKIRQAHPMLHTDVTDFTIRLHTIWMFVFLKEILISDMNEEETEQALSNYIQFEIHGWKRLLNNDRYEYREE